MSGDVQPKKRRDKRKKKEDQIEDTVAHQHAAPTQNIPVDDSNIHIHKEKTIGGGICAKCIFFIITIAIAIVIGLTITEHRGLTDIDIPLSESRFASIFEGWIDTERSDDHDEGIGSDEVSFDQDEDSHEEEDDDDDEGVASQEEDEDEVEESTEETEQEETQEDDEEEEEEDTIESEEDQEESEEPEESPEQEASPEQEEDEGSPEQESQEDMYKSEEQESEEQEEEPAQSKEEPEEQESLVDDDDDDGDQPGSNEIDQETNNDELQEEIEDPQTEEITDATTSGVAAKFGVGVALLIVAYVVLIKKWKSDKLPEEPTAKNSETESPNLSRRNTFIPPPELEEVEQDMDNIEDEYSEDEDVDESDEEEHIPASIRQYEELRATYTRSLTPEAQLGPTEDQYEEEIEEEIEEEEEEYDDEREGIEYNDDEDEELMKKLEEKYGRIDKRTKYEDEQEDEEEDDEDYDSWKRIKGIGDNAAGSESDDEPHRLSGAQSYEFDNITSPYDYAIRRDLDYAEEHLQNNVPLALNLFIKILETNPESPRALYGRARALDHLAEKKRSNEILQESIKYFLKVLRVKNTPDVLFLAAAERSINRMRFIGSYSRAIEVHNLLIEKFPNVIKYRNDLSVTLLTINRIPQARKLLSETLKLWPNSGFALVHYGFILKTVDNNLPLAIDYLTKGIETKEPGVVDGRFYFHLGDALSRSGKNELAMKIYEEGVSQNVFLSKYQRSLYNVDRLTGRPWWAPNETPYTKLFQLLQHHWRDIRKEGFDILNKEGYFKDEAENLRDVGDWKQFELYARGIKNKENCRKCPLTCQIIDSFPEAKTCTRGQVKFSVMHPGTHVWPHCGPTNCRLRSHLGLKVPARTYIRVAEEIRSWEEGSVFVFDDSFEHEVWHNGTDFRLVLIVDVWHPELTKSERINLSPI